MIGFRFPGFGWGASFWAFLVTMISQHFASLQEGPQYFLQFFAFCSETAMSRQDNFFLLKCLFIYIGGIYWYAMDINFFLFSCCVMVIFVLLFFSWDFSFFFVVLRRCFVRICSFNTFTCSVYFGAGFVGTFLAGWVVNFLSAWGSAMWRVGPVQFIWVLAWSRWRGCKGFFLGSVEVGMVRLK